MPACCTVYLHNSCHTLLGPIPNPSHPFWGRLFLPPQLLLGPAKIEGGPTFLKPGLDRSDQADRENEGPTRQKWTESGQWNSQRLEEHSCASAIVKAPMGAALLSEGLKEEQEMAGDDSETMPGVTKHMPRICEHAT